MGKILNVAEKPSVAKSISRILSTNCRNVQGKHKYCQNIFFQYRDEMIFTSVLGHLFTHDFEERTRWDECDPGTLLSAPIVKYISTEMKPAADNIRSLATQCEKIVIWTDCDREGENIAAQIKDILPPNKTVKRARFSAISRREIEYALDNLTDINYNESESVNARIELDLRIGSAFTRLQTLAYKNAMQGSKSVLSFGPCQIPTLNFVVERYRRIGEFVPETFYGLENRVQKSGVATLFKWARGRVYDKNCSVHFYTLLASGQAAIIKKSVQNREKFRPLPLRTVEFQKVCSSYYKMSGHRLMEIAEKLYNNGYISYPRTETDSFPRDFDFTGIVKKLQADPAVGEYSSHLAPIAPRIGKNSDQAHSPIYPLKAGIGLESEERKVYEFIARRFLGCISKNAKGIETEYTMKIESTDGRFAELFTASGLIVTERNYLEIYHYDRWESSQVGEFEEGEGTQNNIEISRGETKAPEYLSESDLITLMDKNGIGTDATIHEHIQKIQARGYARKEKQKIIPCVLGINLIQSYDTLDLNVSRPILRKNLEENLMRICNGSTSRPQVVSEELRMYREIYSKFADGIELFKRTIVQEREAPQLRAADNSSDGGDGSEPGIARPLGCNSKENNKNRPKSTKKPVAASPRAAPPKAGKRSQHIQPNQYAQADTQAVIKCHCGMAAEEFTSNKSSSTGRSFYACHFFPRKCDFFHWEGTPLPTAPRNGLSSLFSDRFVCNCGSDAIKKQANTEANRGREFYCCNRTYKRCKFFKWADEP